VVSVEQFVHGKKDVLVATDIASKGLDFPNIQHVVNYDMPDDIENYGQLLVKGRVYLVMGNQLQSYGASPTIWNHTVLPVTRQR